MSQPLGIGKFLARALMALPWQPRLALGAMLWRLMGKRLRSRHWLSRALAGTPMAYHFWVSEEEAIFEPAALMERWALRPKISLLLQVKPGDMPGDVAAAIEAVVQQRYPDWELLIAGPCHGVDALDDRISFITPDAVTDIQAIELTAALAMGAFVMPLKVRTRLSTLALFRCVEAMQGNPQTLILYGDEDGIDARGKRSSPWLKPQWNALMALAQDYVSNACMIETRLARTVLPLENEAVGIGPYAVFMKAALASADQPPLHIPHILASVARRQDTHPQTAARKDWLDQLLLHDGASVEPAAFGTISVLYPLPETLPKVSVIVPTRDKPELLKACIESVLAKTDYPQFEVLIVDNGSSEPETHALFAQLAAHPAVRILPYDQPYNYSAINNFAAQRATGIYLCLLNNDTEVITPAWLSRMMRFAVRPEVGAVGAKLLFADNTIQHAGVVIGMGNAAGHAHRFLANDQPGYFAHAHVQRHASAVTAACLVVSREKFKAVGGLDEIDLQIAYNDVDFCLKLQKAGWHNVYEPAAALYHFESKSRGNDFNAAHIERYMRELGVLQKRWDTETVVDPDHHPRLDRGSEDYVLRFLV